MKFNITQNDYEKLRRYTYYKGMNYGLTKEDCEDIMQDAVVKCMERGDEPSKLNRIILSCMGNYIKKLKKSGIKVTISHG